MKGKNILVTAACVIGFGGIIGNTLVGVATSRELKAKINNVEKNAKEADERYDASTRQELTNLINQTRDSITSTFQAAQQGMQASVDEALAKIEEAKAELARDLEGEMDSKDAALRTQLVNQLNTLAQQIAGTLTSLGNDVAALDAAQQQMASTLADIADRTEELEGKVEDLEGTVNEVIDFANQIANFALTLNTKLNQTNQVLTELQSNLAANYYTAAQVNEFVTAIGNSLDTLTSFFMVGGSVKTMQALVDEMSVLGGDMESFNGDEATAAKAQYVEELFAIIAAYDHDVTDTYNAIVAGYNHQSLAVPAAITTLRDNLLASSGLAELKDKMMVAMTKIILAPTKEAAKEIRDQYAGNVEYEIDALRFELDRITASNAIFDLKSTGATYNFTDTEFNFFNDVMTYAFDNTDPSITDKAQYYADAKADLAFRVEQAKGLKSLQTKLNARYAEIQALNDGVRLTNLATITPYLDVVDELAKVATYKTAIAELDGTELKLNTKEKISTYVDSIDADAELVAYAADKYELLLQAQKTNKGIVNGYTAELATLDAGYEGTIVDAIAAAVLDTAYQAAMNAARGDNTLETVAARKDYIDKYIADKSADCVYQARVAKYLVDVKDAANQADSYIDGLGDLSANEKTVLKGAYASANVPTLDALYTATYKGVKEGDNKQYSTEEQFTALLNKATADITAIRTIATKEAAMNKDAADRAGELDTAIAGETDATIIGIGNELKEFVGDALDNYGLVSDTAIAFVTPTEEQVAAGETKATLTAALATGNATSEAAATKLAVDSYTEYLALVNAATDLNNEVDHRMLTFVTAFKAAHHNKAGDQDTVVSNHAADIDNLKTKYKKVLVDSNPDNAANVLPAYVCEGSNYDDDYTALVNFQAALAPYNQKIATDKAAFNTAADKLLEEMVDEFDAAELATMKALKLAYVGAEDGTGTAGEGTKVAALYAKIKTKIGTDTAKLALAEAINGSLIDNINRATSSDGVLDVYEAMCKSFLEDVFGQARDTTTYETAEAQLEAYLA